MRLKSNVDWIAYGDNFLLKNEKYFQGLYRKIKFTEI